MTLVVGLPRDARAPAAVQLGVMLARSLGQDLVVCTVVPPPWPPGLGKIDAEYQSYLDEDAHAALDDARALIPGDISAAYEVVSARSSASGLLEVAEREDAGMLVLGSSTASVFGRVAFGSVADRLLHSSPVPVVLGPRGFRCRSDARLGRLTVAFGGTEDAMDLVVAVAGLAARAGATLRVASFAVRPRTPLTAGIGSRAEASVLHEWSEEVEEAQQAVLAEVAALPNAPAAEGVIGHGRDWASAIEDVDWAEGDLLAVGSSSVAPAARVFIGSRSSKIVRHAPVPVVVLPHGVVALLAERAEQAS